MKWRGVMPAMTTKFCSDDKLDLGLFNKNLDFKTIKYRIKLMETHILLYK